MIFFSFTFFFINMKFDNCGSYEEAFIYYYCACIWNYSIKHLLWLCLHMELCILLFKEYIICQDSNGGFKYKIKLKNIFLIMTYKIVRSQKLMC